MRRSYVALIAVALLSLFEPKASAQFTSPSVWQIVLNNVTAATISGPIQNAGQSSHVVRVISTSTTGHTCSAQGLGSIVLRLEGSWNGVWNGTTWTAGNFVDVGIPITGTLANPDGTLGATKFYSGSFPALRVNIVSADFTNCQYTVWYSGSYAGSFLQDSLRWPDQGFVTVPESLAGTNEGFGSADGQVSQVVYSLVINTASAALTSAVVQANTCSGTIYWEVGNVPANSTYVLPMTGRAYFAGPLNVGLSLCSSGASGAFMNVVFRYE